jgi:hypothetical protein
LRRVAELDRRNGSLFLGRQAALLAAALLGPRRIRS